MVGRTLQSGGLHNSDASVRGAGERVVFRRTDARTLDFRFRQKQSIRRRNFWSDRYLKLRLLLIAFRY